MKKYVIVLLFMAAIFNGFSINKGDSLAILVIIYLFFSGSGSGGGHSGEMAYNSSGQAIGRIQ